MRWSAARAGCYRRSPPTLAIQVRQALLLLFAPLRARPSPVRPRRALHRRSLAVLPQRLKGLEGTPSQSRSQDGHVNHPTFGLYDPARDHSDCGVGFLTRLDGLPSHASR
jgi:hypothetical protein